MSGVPPAMLLGDYTVWFLCVVESLLVICLLVSAPYRRRW